jgi:hypothetical protein
MNSKNIYPLQAYLDVIGNLCYLLDILASPTIEEELDACIDDYLSMGIEILINSDDTSSIIGEAGLQNLRQLDEMLSDGCCCYRDGKGFSKTQRWIDFVVFTNIVNVFLKDAVKRYEVMQCMKNNSERI